MRSVVFPMRKQFAGDVSLVLEEAVETSRHYASPRQKDNFLLNNDYVKVLYNVRLMMLIVERFSFESSYRRFVTSYNTVKVNNARRRKYHRAWNRRKNELIFIVLSRPLLMRGFRLLPVCPENSPKVKEPSVRKKLDEFDVTFDKSYNHEFTAGDIVSDNDGVLYQFVRSRKSELHDRVYITHVNRFAVENE
jgi:hypothetical protein